MDNFIDLIEEIGRLVPEYSYKSLSDIIITDKHVRKVLIDELKQVKDYLFHVVQISYELQKDKLSEASEKAWDDADRLLSQVRNSRTAKLEGRSGTACEECRHRVEHNLGDLIRIDRELLKQTAGLRQHTHYVYRLLLREGKERQFIKNLDKIKMYRAEISELADRRERIIMGV